ncbi:hypothetical protein FQA39_LY16464 [Lamprigera yunnana]|nr:hypothetical protein FQA39_LY16464 [Lamprigera yunnana]
MSYSIISSGYCSMQDCSEYDGFPSGLRVPLQNPKMEQNHCSTSGAAKKSKLKDLKDLLAKIPKLTHFLKPEESVSNEITLAFSIDEGPLEPQPLCCKDIYELKNTDVNKQNLIDDSEKDLLVSTDTTDFQNSVLTDNLKKLIIFTDSCRSERPFKRDPLQNNRIFSTD